MSEGTTEAVVTILGVEAVAGSRSLVAMVHAEIAIAGVPLVIQGMQLRRKPDGGYSCHAPTYRGPDGRWLPALVLPPDLAEGLAAEVFAAMARPEVSQVSQGV